TSPSATFIAGCAIAISCCCVAARLARLLDLVNNIVDYVTFSLGASHGDDIRNRFRAARRRGPPLQSPLHAADRRAAGWVLAKPLLARRSARALRTRPPRTTDGNGAGGRPRPRSRLSQPHLARLQRGRVQHQRAIRRRPAP